MPVIVFNKRTGKYLRRHSGSFNHACRKLSWNNREKIKHLFGSAPSIKKDIDKWREYQTKVDNFCIDMMCDAEPGDARIYANENAAKRSVGPSPTWFELHEVKESFICVMRPNGSSNCDEK